MLNTLLSSSTLTSLPLLLLTTGRTGRPSASVIDTPLVVSAGVAELLVGAVVVDELVVVVGAVVVVVVDGVGVEMGVGVGCGIAVAVVAFVDDMDDVVEAAVVVVVDEVVALADGVDLGDEEDVSLGVGLLSAVMVSSSDCRTMGSICGAYFV